MAGHNRNGWSGLNIGSELRGVLTGLSFVAALVLLAVSIDPGVPGQELLGSLRFHIAILFVLLPIGLMLTGARLRALVMLGLVGLSLAQGAGVVLSQQQRRADLEGKVPAASLRVLSFNVLVDNPRGADATAFILDNDADVVVLLEAAGLGAGLQTLGSRYPYHLGCDVLPACGVAIFSRTPLADTHTLRLDGLGRRRLFIASTAIEGKPITIVAMHLTKPYFDNVADLELGGARAVIGAIEGPMVLAGDFNAAAWSDPVARFANDLGLIPPPGYPATWPVAAAPLGVPIDNMFTHGAALIRDIAPTPSAFGSNHLGLMATVDLF